MAHSVYVAPAHVTSDKLTNGHNVYIFLVREIRTRDQEKYAIGNWFYHENEVPSAQLGAVEGLLGIAELILSTKIDVIDAESIMCERIVVPFEF